MINFIECYHCDNKHEGDISDEELISDEENTWGWCWGNDGFAPENASAMYACPQHKEF